MKPLIAAVRRRGTALGLAGIEKVPLRESTARAGLEISFQSPSVLALRQGDVRNELPRFELVRVHGLACVVLIETLLQIACETDVGFIGSDDTLKDIDVEHKSPPSLAGLKFGQPIIRSVCVDTGQMSMRSYGGHLP